jgi:hypothetical protein
MDLIFTLIFIFVGLPVIGWFVYQTYRDLRESQVETRPLASSVPPTDDDQEELRQKDLANAAASGTGSGFGNPPGKPISAALGWNVATIVVGCFFALCGFIAWFGADPANSAFRQTVAALWLIAALMGFVIAAIGVLGATIVHAIERRPLG